MGNLMEDQKSHFLHFLRWSSALFVVLGHSQLISGVGSEIFSMFASHAHAAVMVFFVLSGYVIAAAIEKRQNYSARQYFIDRISRIYSVLLPAILLTLFLDFLGGQYSERYSNPDLIPQTNEIIRFLVNLFCLQGIWGYRVQLGSNPALWSIGYEFFYYVIFGLIVWRPRCWIVIVMLLSLIVGPKVLIYGIIWTLGAVAFRLNKSGLFTPLIPSFALFIFANYFLQYDPVFQIPKFCMDFLFAISVMLLIMTRPRFPHRLFSINREMAGFSFSLYAYHMPVMFFVHSLAPNSPFPNFLVIMVSLMSAKLLYYFTENQRDLLKIALSKVRMPRVLMYRV